MSAHGTHRDGEAPGGGAARNHRLPRPRPATADRDGRDRDGREHDGRDHDGRDRGSARRQAAGSPACGGAHGALGARTTTPSDPAAPAGAPADVPAEQDEAAAADLLRSAFRRHAAGVAVITARDDGGSARPGSDPRPGRVRGGPGAADRPGAPLPAPVGFTATSLTSVAARPPLLSFGIGTASSCWPALARAEHVGVHLLAEDQAELAATFATPGADRFAPPTRWRFGPAGVPLLEGVPAWLVCRVVARVPAGDHRIVVARILTGDGGADGARPLVYHRGAFTGLRD